MRNMKRLPSELQHRNNRTAIVFCFVLCALFVLFMSLPVYEFNTCLYTKKSGNTFVGDERYIAASAEVSEVAAQYQQQKQLGNVTISEAITERVNSKGETTSLITFQVNASAKRNGWSFISSGLPSGTLLLVAAIAVAVAMLLMLLSLRGTMSTSALDLPKRVHVMRCAACWLALVAMLAVTVFHFYTVRILQRDIIAKLASEPTEKLSSLLTALDAFLYDGQGGLDAAEMAKGLTYASHWSLWLMLPTLFALLLNFVLLYKGELKHTLARGVLYVFVIALCVLVLYPYYVMLVTGFRTNAESTDMYFNNIFPTTWVWSNLSDILNRGVLGFLGNSMLLSLGATAIALLCGIPAAYAMARMNFKGKKLFLGYVIMSQMFAPVVLLVGISQLMNTLHLNDSVFGLMLINAAFNQAFAIWLLRGTFVSISPEMEQAACIDGCSTGSALVRVLLPMAAPGIVTTLIFVFINAWNEYTISTILISTPAKKPITVGITQFSSFNMIEWQYLFASALLATIPVVIMFMFIEKHLVAGLTSGGVKG